MPARHVDGIAVTEFEFDSHAVRKYDPAYPLLRPGYFFISHDPFQLPYRIMVPKHVDGLLVPVIASGALPMPNLRVFLSYRRDDLHGHAPEVVGRIHDRLIQHCGAGNFFMDIDTIPPGADFVE